MNYIHDFFIATLVNRLYNTNLTLTKDQSEESDNIINSVNQLAAAKVSRNFAIVQVLGKQFRVTDGDVIVLEGFWPPNIGDRIQLDKVVFAGTKDFSLIGLPLVQPGLVNVLATVIGKELSYTKTRFRKKKRKQFMRINFIKVEQTSLRINTVEIGSHLNNPSEKLKFF